jgi:cytochrome c553
MKTASALLSAWSFAALALVAAPALATEAAPSAAQPDLAKGQATAEVCQACHMADGTRGAPANPIIAGQFPEYLAKQLHDFKSGKRKNPIMEGMAAALTDEDIVNVTAFYAGKQAKPGAAKNKETVLAGERIWRGGIADRTIPACAGCHGPAGAGLPIQYPMLAGQHADYTETQLLTFRVGERANSAPMTGVAAKMNDAEIKAVADYIAGLR